MNTPSNRYTGFAVKRFHAFTETITRPYVAWSLVFLVITNVSLIGWGMQRYFTASTTYHPHRLEFDRYLLESQEEIQEKLEKVLAKFEGCQ